MRRIDRYWKRCAAGMMAALMLMTAGEGGFTSFAAQSLNSPSKIVISNTQTQEGNVSALQSAPVTTAAFGTVTTPVTDASSYFGAGRMTMLANHDTRAQQLAVIIENGAGGLIVVDGGWQENSAYVLDQIKQRGGHVAAWLLTHPDSDHVGALADILYNHSSEITIDGIYYSFLEDSWMPRRSRRWLPWYLI